MLVLNASHMTKHPVPCYALSHDQTISESVIVETEETLVFLNLGLIFMGVNHWWGQTCLESEMYLARKVYLAAEM